MIGHLEIGVRYWNAYVTRVMGVVLKICPRSQEIFLKYVRTDLDSIMNAEHFARID